MRKGDYDSAIKGGSERAIADYEKALSLDPSDAGASGRSGVEANFYTAEFDRLQARSDEALRLYKVAASACPRGFIEYRAGLRAMSKAP